jgi:hypothetical protein
MQNTKYMQIIGILSPKSRTQKETLEKYCVEVRQEMRRDTRGKKSETLRKGQQAVTSASYSPCIGCISCGLPTPLAP